jgi:mannose-6-phosphate isomerase-like protein (cupin superfamily)
MRISPSLRGLALALPLLACSTPPAASPLVMTLPDSPDAAVFSMAELAPSARPWTQFLDESTLRTGVYRLAKGATDGQQPHDQDEVYHVVSGKAVLEAGEERFPVGPGSVAFVRREIPHRFVEIEEELVLLVFFSTAVPSNEEPAEGS